MNDRELWLAVRRALLAIIAALDTRFDVRGKAVPTDRVD